MGFHLWAQPAVFLLLRLVIHGNLHLRGTQSAYCSGRTHIFSLFSNTEVVETHSSGQLKRIRASFTCRTPWILCILRGKKSHHLKFRGRGKWHKVLLKFKYVTQGKWHIKPSIIIFITTDLLDSLEENWIQWKWSSEQVNFNKGLRRREGGRIQSNSQQLKCL